ncbi:hypothetical protein [Pseudoalteromonas umbrosa]|nr:hypothetical protein [Pseudoalteromonas sp. B95]MDK1289530.1 hypothetical protein [Pseudoalteromonas sp. B95]
MNNKKSSTQDQNYSIKVLTSEASLKAVSAARGSGIYPKPIGG